MICVALFLQILPNRLTISPSTSLGVTWLFQFLDYSTYSVISSQQGAVGSVSAWQTRGRGSDPG